MAIQETLIKNRTVIPSSQYNIVTSEVTKNDNHERGAALLICKSYTYEQIQVNTNLQLCTIKLYLEKTYTICSIYLPHIPITKKDIMRLMNQLSKSFIIMGDMNARSTIWEDTNRNDKGEIVEEVALDANVIVMNNRNLTHYHSQTNIYSVIDLTIRSADCRLDFMHEVIQDLYDSNHYPTQLKSVTHNLIPAKINKFNTKKADWDTFRQLIIINLNELSDVNTATDIITKCIIEAAEQAIPRVKTNLQRTQ